VVKAASGQAEGDFAGLVALPPLGPPVEIDADAMRKKLVKDGA